MSADNGIYILESPVRNGEGKEYRVAECQAIENINYCPDDFLEPIDRPFWNLPSLYRSFGKLQVFRDEAAAMQEAQRLYDDPNMMVCEYGICPIQMDRPFPTFDEVLRFTMMPLDHAFSEVPKDNNYVEGRKLYKVRGNLMDVLWTLIDGLRDVRVETASTKPTTESVWDGSWEDGPFKERDWDGETVLRIAVKPTGHTGQLFEYSGYQSAEPHEIVGMIKHVYRAGYDRGLADALKR